MRHHRGKTFLPPPRLFKADSALYFPNMQGYTLADPSVTASTTDVLTGRNSIVSVYSGTWAQRQTESFVGVGQNPALGEEVERLGVQRVWVNVEEDWVRAGLVWMFLGRGREGKGVGEWGRSFVVRRGVGSGVREGIGMANGKVGYVYLVDGRCRIRWAGSGDAGEGEREGLVRGVRRLVEGGRKGGEGGRMD